MCLDAADDLLYLAADLNLGAEKLFGLLDCLAGNDLANLELKLCKIIILDLSLRLDVDDRLFFLCFLSFRLCCLLCRAHSLYLFHHFLEVHSCEQDLRCVGYMLAGRIQTKLVHLRKGTLLCMELGQDLPGGIRHEGLQQGRADSDGLYQIVENGCQTVFLSLVLCQCPRHGLVDIFVTAAEDVENLGDGICHTKLIHLALCLLYGCQSDIL